ncbi:helix-turn-helix transcriptional regulator [candidate division KSB1 bacterium]|nr:helix-turn-helix transcriptional regulator [candidate division KSB1 bacterium]
MKNLLKLRRWEKGIKQYELAIKLECSAPYLSMVEGGRIDPPDVFKERVAAFFGMSVEEIFPQAPKSSE